MKEQPCGFVIMERIPLLYLSTVSPTSHSKGEINMYVHLNIILALHD